jgi:hypothetical protein
MSLGDHAVRAVTGGVTGGHPSHVVVWGMTYAIGLEKVSSEEPCCVALGVGRM